MMNSMRSETLKVGKLNIRYLTGGQGDPIVVIHGGGDGARAWLQNAAELSKHYSVYVPDLPGFGLSQTLTDSFQIKHFVDFVEDFSTALGLKSFHLVGHSVGGGIALHYALKFPHKVRKLVLVNSLCLGKEIALWVRFLSHRIFVNYLGEAAFAILKSTRWLIRFFCPQCKFNNPLSRLKMSIGHSMTTLKGQTGILITQLSELIAPTLLVWGAKDAIVPVSHAYAAAEVIPECLLHVFADAGHSAYKQKVNEFCQLLGRFLG